ncbi:MAG: hypothetical protein GKR94_25550 [Gammaproteobacteria bacterium]|nr:hypothetical protein [Gammaproteobacteria bacterium]
MNCTPGGDLRLGKMAEQMFSGAALTPHVATIAALCRRTGAQRILDYGCGKALVHHDGAALEEGEPLQPLTALWRVSTIDLYDPAYPPYARRPEALYDGVVCTEVLEYCPSEAVPVILLELFGFATHFVFLSIVCTDVDPERGEVERATVRAPDWWRQQLLTAQRARPQVFFVAACSVTHPDNNERHDVYIEG